MIYETKTSPDHACGRADPDRSRLESHWREIGGDLGGVPYRAAIDPVAIAPFLDRVLLLERTGAGSARVRLAGRAIAERLGIDLSGEPLGTMMVASSRDWLAEAVETLFDAPARVELGLVSSRRTFRPCRQAGLLLLPLRDRAGQINRAMGFLTLPEPGLGAGSLRFEIAGETRRALTGGDPRPDMFDRADRAREIMRRRRQFHVVQD